MEKRYFLVIQVFNENNDLIETLLGVDHTEKSVVNIPKKAFYEFYEEAKNACPPEKWEKVTRMIQVYGVEKIEGEEIFSLIDNSKVGDLQMPDFKWGLEVVAVDPVILEKPSQFNLWKEKELEVA